MLLELRDKLPAVVGTPPPPGVSTPTPLVPSTGEERLRSMLTGMGFRPAEADRAVAALGPRAASEPIEALLREALALLAK